MTNLEMIKTMNVGSQWIFNTTVNGNDRFIAVYRHATGFQIHTRCEESDIQKWLNEEYKEPKGE